MNWLIKLLARFHKPIEGNPSEWLERPYRGDWREFLCGSCKGVYRTVESEFQVLAVVNTRKNNDFDRTLDWFERSCRREKRGLAFLEVGNPELREKLAALGFSGDKKRMTKVFL